jgi:hypothetical protein
MVGRAEVSLKGSAPNSSLKGSAPNSSLTTSLGDLRKQTKRKGLVGGGKKIRGLLFVTGINWTTFSGLGTLRLRRLKKSWTGISTFSG